MVDVAREAGVAVATVSRVVNGEPVVRPATRDRVNAAIERLGYQRNDAARMLKSGRSMTIGVVIAGSELFELPRILLGVEQAAAESSYWVNLASWQGGGPDALPTTVRRLIGQGAEGVAVIADRPVAAEALERLSVDVPISVVMSGDLSNPAIGSVELDQRLGARLVTRHLLDLGHREIAHLSGRLTAFDAQARVEGWRAELESAGVPVQPVLEGDFTAESGYQLARRMMAGDRLPTAVFAANDQMAMGVLAAFAEGGVVAPRDVSLVGFDDVPGAGYLVPALTTVRQDFVTLGRRAIEVLMEMIGGAEARHHLIPPTLVVRRSTQRVE